MQALNATALFVQFMKNLPVDVRAGVNAERVRTLIATAWDNGWRDADWLSNCALMGIDHGDVRNPPAYMLHYLTEVAEMPCPTDSTPEPLPISEVLRHPGHVPASPEVVAAKADSIRRSMGQRRP